MAGRAGAAAPLCSERFGSGRARSCRAAADGSLRWEGGARRWWGRPGAPAPLSRLLTVLLPQGFPESVSADYLPYQLWDSVQVGGRARGRRAAGLGPGRAPHPALSLQAFASSLSGSLATHAVLLGIGVGNAEASVSAATATWLVKGKPGAAPPRPEARPLPAVLASGPGCGAVAGPGPGTESL